MTLEEIMSDLEQGKHEIQETIREVNGCSKRIMSAIIYGGSEDEIDPRLKITNL